MTTPVAAGAPVFALALYEGQPYTDTDIVVDLQAHLAALVENPNTRSRLRSRVDPEARWLWTLMASVRQAADEYLTRPAEYRPERLAVFNIRVDAAIRYLEQHIWSVDDWGEPDLCAFNSRAHELLQLLALVAYEHQLPNSLNWVTREAQFLLGLPGGSHRLADLVLGLATRPYEVDLPEILDCRRDTTMARGRVLRERGLGPAPLPVQVIDDAVEPSPPPDANRPTLVVVPSLDHLPRPSSEGRLRRDAPAGDFGAIAGKALPLVMDGSSIQGQFEAMDALYEEFPWAQDQIQTLMTDRVAASRLRPTLFVGEPGAGKTRLAHAIGTRLGLPVTIYGCAGVSDSSFGGTSRQWSSGRASVPLQAIRRSLVANPLVVLDEIEKAGTRSENGRLVDSLIPFLELETARETFDPYLECPVDLSAVAYIATANSLSGIPGPLLDRFRVLEIPVPRREHLPAIIRTMTQDVRAERGGDPAWMPDLDGEEIQLIANQWDGGSMRRLRRMVEVMLSGRETLAARH